MAKFQVVFLAVIIGACVAVPTDNRCRLPIKQFGFHAPIAFNENGKLYDKVDKNNNLILDAGQTVILSCNPQYFKNQEPKRSVSLTAVCISGTTLKIKNQNTDYINDLGCDLRALEEVLVNVRECPTINRGVEFGYFNPIDHRSYIVGESCYSTQEKRTIFTHVKLRNNSNVETDVILRTEAANYLKGPHPSYTARIQFLKSISPHKISERLERIFGEDHNIVLEHKRYISEKYFSSQQFQTALSFTWNDLVVVGNDRSNNNLGVLQQDVSELGVFHLDIYTGSHGVVSYMDKTGNPVNLSLEDGSFPVPKYIWTVVKSEDQAAVFIYLNNPHATEEDITRDPPCENKCPLVSWATNLRSGEQFKSLNDGYVWCCELKDVREKFTEIPDLVDVVKFFK